MNASRMRALTRRALEPARSPSEQLLKVRAIGDLLRCDDSPASVAQLRAEIEAIVETDAPPGYQGARAFSLALQLLDEIERPADGAVGFSWENPRLTEEERRRWFELDLVDEMSRVRGWSIGVEEWLARSERIAGLAREADEILAAADPPQAFERWRAGIGANTV